MFSSRFERSASRPFARLTDDSAMGNLLFGSRPIETSGTTSTERKLSPVVRCGVSPDEQESAPRYICYKSRLLISISSRGSGCFGMQVYQIQWNNAINGHCAVQGHSKSPILVPIESSLLVINTNLPPILRLILHTCTVSKLWLIIGQIFTCDREVPHFNAIAGGDLLRISE